MSQRTIVTVETGETLTFVAKIEDKTGHSGNTYSVFYTISQINKDGTPDKRSRPSRIGVSHSQYGGGIDGRYAFTTPEQEAKAQPIRAEIALLESKIRALKTSLVDVYNPAA